MKLFQIAFLAALAFAAGGCATTYQLTLIPRDSGKLYAGVARQDTSGEGRVSITIEGKTYDGTWVQAVPERTHGYVSGGYGWGNRRGGEWGLGSAVNVDTPGGGMATALLQAPDGTGLRCEFVGGGYGHGGGTCRDDKGLVYDVQLRAKSAS